jgi:hypothetical protein
LAAVFGILKARWPEAILIIVLQAGLMVLFEEIAGQVAVTQQGASTSLPPHMGFVLIGASLCLVILLMLYLGFLATAYREGAAPKQPGELVGVGRLFFWRILRFLIIWSAIRFGVAYMFIAFIYSTILKANESMQILEVMWHLCLFGAIVVLMKPTLFTPAVMIVRDYMVTEALALLKEFRLMEAKWLVWLFLVCFGSISLLSCASILTHGTGFFFYALTGIKWLIGSALMLAAYLGAVLFVASKTSVTTEPAESRDNNLTAD